MRAVLGILGFFAWGAFAVHELGASFDWWSPPEHFHWWLAGCFFFLAIDSLADAAKAAADL